MTTWDTGFLFGEGVGRIVGGGPPSLSKRYTRFRAWVQDLGIRA